MKATITIALAIALFSATMVHADVPHTIGYQGVLVDNVGNAVPDGNYTITFRLYHSDTGGSSFWSETLSVAVTNGRFDAILGKTVVLDVGFGLPYWLSLEVAPDPEMTDRIELTSVPYALNVKDESISANKIADNTVVRSINGLRDDVILKAGANILLTENGDTITVTGTGGGGGGLTLPFAGNINSGLGTSGFSVTQDGHGHAAVFETTHDTGSGHALLVQGIGNAAPARIEFNDNTGGFYPALEVVTQRTSALAAHFIGGRGVDIEDNINNSVVLTLRNTDTGGSSSESIVFENENGGSCFISAKDDDFINLSTRNSLVMGNNRPNGRLVFQASGFFGLELDENGSVLFGYAPPQGIGDDGEFRLMRDGLPDGEVMRGSNDTHGGVLEINDEAGNTMTKIWGDTNGSGVFADFYSDIADVGFRINGNYAGTGDPRIQMMGASNANFNMDQAGDASVELPNNAVNASETLDEAGVASEIFTGFFHFSGGVETVVSRTITAPAAGYVLVIATAQANAVHTSGSNTILDLGVSDVSTSFPPNQDVPVFLTSAVPTGQYTLPATVHGLFQVNAGANTFYFIGQESGGVCSVSDVQMTVVYLPTAYGTVDPTSTSGPLLSDEQSPERGRLSDGELAAERAASIAANQERIERELAAMRERMAALERELALERQGD